MKFHALMTAGAAALSLYGCAGAPRAPVITADALLAPTYANPAGEPFDVTAFFDAMPQWLEISFADSTFNPASGAMAVSDLVLSIRGVPKYRLHIDRAQMWDADADALARVMSGSAPDSMTAIIDRVAFEGVRSEGLQWENGAQSLSLTIDKIVLDGLDAQSFILAPLQDVDSETAPAISLVRTLAAVANAYALDGAAFANLNLRMNESQGSAVVFYADQVFSRGYDRGRTAYERIDGVKVSTRTLTEGVLTNVAERIEESLSQNPEEKILQPWMRAEVNNALSNPVAFIAQNAGALATDREIDSIEITNADVSGALSWLAKWQAPPITETNILDFGEISIIGSRESWNGAELYSVARSEIEAFDFYWLIPSNYVQTDTGITLSLLDAIDMSVDDFGFGGNADTGSQEILQIRDAITRLGLETIRGDSVTRWNWDGGTGALNTGASLSLDALMETTSGLEAEGPSLADWNKLVSDGASGDEIAKAIFLKQMNVSVSDEQLLDRAFAYAATQISPDASGADLRQSAPAMIRLAATQAAQFNPRIPGYVDALTAFVGTGGSLTVEMRPDAPVSLTEIQKIASSAPQTLPDVLGLSVTHTDQ